MQGDEQPASGMQGGGMHNGGMHGGGTQNWGMHSGGMHGGGTQVCGMHSGDTHGGAMHNSGMHSGGMQHMQQQAGCSGMHSRPMEGVANRGGVMPNSFLMAEYARSMAERAEVDRSARLREATMRAFMGMPP